MLLQIKTTYIYTVVSSWNIQRILFHYADNIETPKFLLYLRQHLHYALWTYYNKHITKDVASVSMVTIYTISKLYIPNIFFSWFTITNQMTLNLTFLGVLKRLKTDLSSQAQIQLWFITYIWISYIWSHNDEHYLSSSETVPEKNSRLYIWTHYPAIQV